MPKRLARFAVLTFWLVLGVSGCTPPPASSVLTPTLGVVTVVIAPRSSPTSTVTIATTTPTAAPTSTRTAIPATATLTRTPPVTTLAPQATAPRPTLTHSPTALRTATNTRAAPTATPTSSIIYAPPVLYDPPDGRRFSAKSTILRWRTSHTLEPDEYFQASVWFEYLIEQAIIGTTREQFLPIDLQQGLFRNRLGTFFWSVRIMQIDNVPLSNPSQPFSFTQAEQPATPVP